METIAKLLDWGKEELEPLGPVESQASAEALLTEVTGLSRSSLYLQGDQEIDSRLAGRFREDVRTRKQGMPVAYITGKAWFWNEVLKVGPGCLIPRQDTEVLVEKFIENSGWNAEEDRSFLDLGCGSGAIGIALARHYPGAQTFFSDISARALEITRENLKSHGLMERARLIQSDLFAELTGLKWDAVLSNPPYLSEEDWTGCQAEVLREPREALDGGTDGLKYYRALAAGSPEYLKPGGWIVLEAGQGQSKSIRRFLSEAGFKRISIYKDYAGIERVVMAQLDG